jgi:hypothetical protein
MIKRIAFFLMLISSFCAHATEGIGGSHGGGSNLQILNNAKGSGLDVLIYDDLGLIDEVPLDQIDYIETEDQEIILQQELELIRKKEIKVKDVIFREN